MVAGEKRLKNILYLKMKKQVLVMGYIVIYKMVKLWMSAY
jgi:hypothetical protein